MALLVPLSAPIPPEDAAASDHTDSGLRHDLLLRRRIFPAIWLQIVACLFVWFAFHSHVPSAHAQSAEYKIKAAYLFNFAQFVDWPTNRFTNETSPIIVGVLGRDPFGPILDQILQSEVVKNRKIEVRRYRSVKETQECHMLFISATEAPNIKSILASLKGQSILTVADMDDFAVNGGMIRFLSEKNKIRFRINLQSIKEAHLFVSSKLLQLAEVVPAEKRP